MNNLELNIPILIFIAGAALFLLAPSAIFSSFSSDEIYRTALMIESVGIAIAFTVFYRDKISALSA